MMKYIWIFRKRHIALTIDNKPLKCKYIPRIPIEMQTNALQVNRVVGHYILF